MIVVTTLWLTWFTLLLESNYTLQKQWTDLYSKIGVGVLPQGANVGVTVTPLQLGFSVHVRYGQVKVEVHHTFTTVHT